MQILEMEAIIEALLFAAGDSLSLEKISEITDFDKKTVKAAISGLAEKLSSSDRGIMVRELNGRYQLCTKPAAYNFVQKLAEPRGRQSISQAAYEVLSIVAYNQPITRAGIEQVRGVNSDSAVIRLVEKNLIKEAGKAETPGRPMLYCTTEDFLRSFGLSNLKDLPPINIEEEIHAAQDQDIQEN